MKLFKNISICFSAGTIGGIVNALFVWGMGATGLSAAIGIKIAPPWSPAFLYQRMVWGGIWGFIFLLPILRKSIFLRGVLMGIAPTLVVLFVVLPYQLKKGMMGLELGALVPVFALVANAIWGVSTAFWIQKTDHDL